MLYNNRMYPHPVLGIGDDIDGNFEVDLNVSSDGNEIKITCSYKLINSDIQLLLKQNKAQFIAHVYCRGTMYRSVFKTTTNLPEAIKIDAIKLSGEVEIDFFICASDYLENYINSTSNTDYNGYSFAIDKGDILAYGGKGKFYANKSPEELKSVSALMNISNTGENTGGMYNEYDGEKITIMLNNTDYQNYQLLKVSNSVLPHVLLSSIVLPALLETLYFIESNESNEFSDRQWYIMLKEIMNKSKDGDKLRIAQNILDQPNDRMFSALMLMIEEQ